MYRSRDIYVFLMYYIWSVQVIPTYRVYRFYDRLYQLYVIYHNRDGGLYEILSCMVLCCTYCIVLHALFNNAIDLHVILKLLKVCHLEVFIYLVCLYSVQLYCTLSYS